MKYGKIFLNRIPCETELVIIEEKYREKSFTGCLGFLECVHICGNGLRRNGTFGSDLVQMRNTKLEVWFDEYMYCRYWSTLQSNNCEK